MDARGRRRRVGPRRRRRLLKGRRGGRSTVGGWLAARREGEARRRIGGGERTPPRGWRTQLSSMSANARVLETKTQARVSRGSGGLRAGACALKRRRAEREKFHISQQPPKASSLECVTFVFVCVSVTCTSYWFDSSANTSRVRRASAAAARGGEKCSSQMRPLPLTPDVAARSLSPCRRRHDRGCRAYARRLRS